VCPKDEVQVIETTQQAVADLLCDATSYAYDPSGLLGLPLSQLPKVAVELMLGLVSNRAGVDDKYIGLILASRSREAGILKER
jgi:hypothetical protein